MLRLVARWAAVAAVVVAAGLWDGASPGQETLPLEGVPQRGPGVAPGVPHPSGLGAGRDVADEPPPLVNEPGIIVLKTGRTISGRITHSAGGYVVEQPQGTVVVPYEMAEFPARDVREAVRLFRERTPNPTAGFHVGLAEWCLTHQLLGEARQELRAALRLEPHRADARNMLRRIDEALEPPAVIESAAITALPSAAGDGFGAAPATSLAGLSRDTARQFTERVQPLLMNKCGNAGCHGPTAENEFRLTRVRLTTGAHRVHAERNLAVTLNYIDVRRPESSPLLVAPQGPHGRAGRSIFTGPAGGEQLETLREWVRQAAGEKAAFGRELRAPAGGGVAARAAGDAPAWPAAAPDRESDVGVRPAFEPWLPGAGETAERGESEFRDGPADAFDPEVFNRLTDDRRAPVRGRRGP